MAGMKPGPKRIFTDRESADRNRVRNAKRAKKAARSGQNIGLPPAVVDWDRRNACRHDLPLFLKTYLAAAFPKPFCPDHLAAMGKAQQAVLRGGLFAQAAPRGDGKTERTKGTALWAVLYGHRRFVLAIGATGPHSEELLDGIRFYLETSGALILDDDGKFTGFSPGNFPLLFEDFPEAVYPILSLEGEARRQGGQRCGGDDETAEKTKIHWGGNQVTFPTVPAGNWIDGKTIGPPPSAGAIIRVSSITGRLRGFNVNGLRPDLVLPDDPQTDESASSPAGNAKLERILAGAVLGLAGPGQKIAGIMPCTVIQQGDAIDNILSHDKHPEWDSSRTKMVYAFPKRLERDTEKPTDPSWEEYRDIRFNYNPQAAGDDKTRAAEDATLYYLRNHEALSEGAVISWPERFASDELDAVQHAMNLFYQDKRAFFAEYQNDPLPPDLGDQKEMSRDEIAGKLSGVARGVVPLDTENLIAFVDVQSNMLFYVVAAWRGDFTGYVVDYGTYPKQARGYFTKADASPTLAHVTGVQGLEAQIRKGLETLVAGLIESKWPREGSGVESRIDRVFIDSGFQAELIYQFCRRSTHAAILQATKGTYVGAASKKGIAEGKPKPGDRHGLEWVLPGAKESRGVKLLSFDTNFWKSFVHSRLAVPLGSAGCLSLFGKDATAHRLIADHLTSEYRTRVASKMREVDEWKVKPGNPDNDFFDCLVGCTMGASVVGAALKNVHDGAKRPIQAAPPRSLSEMKAAAAAKRMGAA